MSLAVYVQENLVSGGYVVYAGNPQDILPLVGFVGSIGVRSRFAHICDGNNLITLLGLAVMRILGSVAYSQFLAYLHIGHANDGDAGTSCREAFELPVIRAVWQGLEYESRV